MDKSNSRFSYREVQGIIERAGLQGQWRTFKDRREFRTKKMKGVLRYVPSTRKAELRGDPMGKAQLWYRIQEVLKADADAEAQRTNNPVR